MYSYKFETAVTSLQNDIIFQKYDRDAINMTSSSQNLFFYKLL